MIGVSGATLGLSTPYAAAQTFTEGLCVEQTASAHSAPMSREPDALMCTPSVGAGVATARSDEPSPDDAARHALTDARALLASGQLDEALESVRVVSTTFPLLRDRFALLEGEILLEAQQPREACAVFDLAVHSPDSTVAARGRVGAVRCRIAADASDARTALDNLSRRYPELSEALTLRYELGMMYERMQQPALAVREYRAIDIAHPGSSTAESARGRLEVMRASGVAVPELTATQQVDRVENFVRHGPIGEARVEVERLLAASLPSTLRARVAEGAVRIARIQGRFADAARYAHIVQTGHEEAPEAEADVSESERASAEARVRQLRGTRPLRTQPPHRLVQIIDVAGRAGLTAHVDEALDALNRRGVPNNARFDAAILASGIGSDEKIVALLEPAIEGSVAARYHRARALERMGRYEDSERELQLVIERDRTEQRYYAMWAEQRVSAVREAIACGCAPVDLPRDTDELVGSARPDRQVMVAALDALGAQQREGERDAAPAMLDVGGVLTRLEPIVTEHGEAYPWLPRVRDLLRLGEIDSATDELYEAYLAWGAANGGGARRSGLEAVYRGDSRQREFIDRKTRRARRELDGDDRRTLAEIASALGDEGTAVGFVGRSRVATRPRAYEEVVIRAAERRGVDPNLLLAVMRVESVYQRRIISYAGAIGLMQIMPRTGRLIADSMGREDFTTADLLDAETNVDFAAWYLASLLERFDGRLPLAIASYNGGPHNVRRWMYEHNRHMPLDAFLETIPFEQTHRYVRRVLTHYREYRAQRSLPMRRLSLELPDVSFDEQVAF